MNKLLKSGSSKGFTLLEMLMVVIIIAILAALAIPQYLKTARRGHAAEAVSNVGDIKGAELRYYAEHGDLLVGTDLDALDIEDPSDVAGAKFTYTVAGNDPDDLTITGDGDVNATTGIQVTYDGSTGAITTTGL